MPNAKIYEELIATRVGDYIIDGFVGAGGQAIVYRAHSQQVGGKYALKVFGLSGPSDAAARGLEAGLSEAKKQSQVDHPAVVKVFTPGIDEVDFQGESRRVLFIPMSYSALGSCEEEPPFAGRQLSDVDYSAMINLLDGLRNIHDEGIIHNDIKPANILKFPDRIDGEDRTVLRITDFGIAKLLRAIGAQIGDPSGLTPPFMSPEQLDHIYSERGDIYSMGATLFHMVTGKPPITSPEEEGYTNLLAWQNAHKSLKRPNAHDLNVFCPPRLALLIMRMMSVDSGNRPSISECIEELRKIKQLLHGKLFEFNPPLGMLAALDSRDFPLRYHPEFRGIFKPEVHEACGLNLFVLRLKMRHPVLDQYKRLVRCILKQFADSFCLYETWGSYDINMFLWSDPADIQKLYNNLREQFPRTEVQRAMASRVINYHIDDFRTLESPSPVYALAVQEGVELPGFESNSYLTGSFPEEIPERSIRAFTYVQVVDDLFNSLLRGAIIQHVREKVADILRKQPGNFRRMSIIELAPEAGSPEFNSTVLIVDFVAAEYRYLPEVPTKIIELGESAVRTVTCLETRRIVLQSGKILF